MTMRKSVQQGMKIGPKEPIEAGVKEYAQKPPGN
jgi:hypothetical protein